MDLHIQNDKNCFLSSRRLRRELYHLQVNSLKFCKVGLENNNIYQWNVTIKGPTGSPYEEGTFKLQLHFTKKYPFEPPMVRFKTRIYHCNVDAHLMVCREGLERDWTASITMSSLLINIYSLMMDPDPEYPARLDAANLYLRDRAKHDRTARLWTMEFASVEEGWSDRST